MRNIFLVPVFFQGLSCIGVLFFQDVFGDSGEYELSTTVSSLGTDIDTIVRIGDDVEVMLDDEHCITLFDEAIEDDEELLDVRKMKPRRWFIEDIDSLGS